MTEMLIGERHDTKPQCVDPHHVPATFNAQMGMTFCWCGHKIWDGHFDLLKARAIYDHNRQGAKIIGWDVYWMDGEDGPATHKPHDNEPSIHHTTERES